MEKVMELLDGKKVSQLTKDRLKEKVEILKQEGITPKLAVIMVGSDSASQIYVRNKSKACDYIGIKFEEHLLPEETKQEELLNLIEELNNKKEINGILLQSPIPRNLDINEAFRKISPEKDVDGFHPVNVGKLVLGQDTFISCTPFGIMKILEEYNIDIEGKNAVVIGRSNIVGKPMSQCLLNKNATVTICHSKTKNLAEITKNADILVAAIGKPCFVTEDMVKPGAIVIDVGINRMEDGKLKGDVDFETVNQKASYITPVPGGVGPMTIAMLMTNVVKAAENQSKN
jgi:methylenetetrahydrofolate dehydrogenase (NADP+)/methenyltetrahydrofolate cyclohydrolase